MAGRVRCPRRRRAERGRTAAAPLAIRGTPRYPPRMNAPKVLAPDGLPRRLFSVADVERMVAAGVVGPDERLEILDGEIVPMSPKGSRHEVLKVHLNLHFAATRPPTLLFAPEPGLRLDPMTYLEPDFLFYPADVPLEAVDGASALLVVEISDSTLGFDLGRKAQIYADHGLREYWVVDAARRETHVHRSPARGGYASVRMFGADERVESEFGGPWLRLADLPTR